MIFVDFLVKWFSRHKLFSKSLRHSVYFFKPCHHSFTKISILDTPIMLKIVLKASLYSSLRLFAAEAFVLFHEPCLFIGSFSRFGLFFDNLCCFWLIELAALIFSKSAAIENRREIRRPLSFDFVQMDLKWSFLISWSTLSSTYCNISFPQQVIMIWIGLIELMILWMNPYGLISSDENVIYVTLSNFLMGVRSVLWIKLWLGKRVWFRIET